MNKFLCSSYTYIAAGYMYVLFLKLKISLCFNTLPFQLASEGTHAEQLI